MLKITNLDKSFGSLQVLKNINLEVGEGEVAVVIGASGTGKSTLLRCINFLERAENGIIEIDKIKVDISEYKEADICKLRAKTSMVFQNYNLFRNKTVLQNVMLPMIFAQHMNKEKAQEKAKAYLRRVNLLDKLNEYPSRLSGGQQQRVGIARAMAVNPKVMLFDEPTSSLDPELVSGILDIIKELANQHSCTMLIVTHEMKFAKEAADTVVFMDEGKIVEKGSKNQIFEAPENERTKRFIQQVMKT